MRREVIGDAVLYLGRCEVVLPTLGRPAALIGDPPYGMNANTDSRRFSGGVADNNRTRGQGKAWPKIIGDGEPFDPTPWLDAADRTVLWGANHYAASLPVGRTLIWLKKPPELFGTFLSDAEVAWASGGHGVWAFYKQFTIQTRMVEADARVPVHPTQKPVSLMSWCIEQARVPAGGVILDPWMGSGSTGVAAVQRGHPFIGVECEPLYFETAIRRLSDAVRQRDLFVPAPVPAPPEDARIADLFREPEATTLGG